MDLSANTLLGGAYLIWNIIAVLMMGLDKYKAKAGSRRISEKALMGIALCFGGLGIFLGMRLFRHKTQHPKFIWGVPLCVLVNIGIIAAAIWYR